MVGGSGLGWAESHVVHCKNGRPAWLISQLMRAYSPGQAKCIDQPQPSASAAREQADKFRARWGAGGALSASRNNERWGPGERERERERETGAARGLGEFGGGALILCSNLGLRIPYCTAYLGSCRSNGCGTRESRPASQRARHMCAPIQWADGCHHLAQICSGSSLYPPCKWRGALQLAKL